MDLISYKTSEQRKEARLILQLGICVIWVINSLKRGQPFLFNPDVSTFYPKYIKWVTLAALLFPEAGCAAARLLQKNGKFETQD